MISSRDLSELPELEGLRQLMQSLAMLDAILMPDWQYRYFSFNSRWSAGAQMGSMRDGTGDHYFALFNAHGCWLKGFCHEALRASDSPTEAAQLFVGMPIEFAPCLEEPAFAIDETTFCIWRKYGSDWRCGAVAIVDHEPDPDGSAELLRFLNGRPETYHDWAADYYEREILLDSVRAIYAQQALDQELVASLDEELCFSDLAADVDEIGYPMAGS
jgi:hypothetical protein